MTNKDIEEWGKEFDELFTFVHIRPKGRLGFYDDVTPDRIKNFITSLLQKQREEILSALPKEKRTDYPVSYDTSEGRKFTAMRDNHAGFNTCLTLVKKLLTTTTDKQTEV